MILLGSFGYIIKLKMFINACQKAVNAFVVAIADDNITKEELADIRQKIESAKAAGLDLVAAFMKRKNGKHN